MKTPESPAPAIPQHDYAPALKGAVSWLGDRYLLAAPLNKRKEDRKEDFVETRRWHHFRHATRPLAGAR